ncbi:carbonic anhydrase [Labrys miyagiensis]|uniref:Carbonic anhydrase n=1 Tax=Labrys miyagiensis TaxID=346912 RepID=A0ABQ6CIM4_9HYPH|nr:acetyltransferase [Labrys miyagiensis]GLS19477.1 carbonic anhydrase [Labrys miyagiensis]
MTDASRPLVIWGGTGHARVLRELAQTLGASVAVVVDSRSVPAPFSGVSIVQGLDGLRAWLAGQPHSLDAYDFAIAVGGGFGRDRLMLASQLKDLGLVPRTLVHPTANVAVDASLQEGCQILMGSAISACATIGRFTIINTKASVDHDCRIGDGVHVAPGATLCGEIQVGDGAFVAAGATILPRLRIGADAVVGAGALVTRDVPAGATVMGCPARVISPLS